MQSGVGALDTPSPESEATGNTFCYHCSSSFWLWVSTPEKFLSTSETWAIWRWPPGTGDLEGRGSVTIQALSDWSVYPLDKRQLQIFLELCSPALLLISACNFSLLSFTTRLTCLPALFSVHRKKICLDFCAIQYVLCSILLFSLLLFSLRPSCRVQQLSVPLHLVSENSSIT